uniref:Uncharacterized protein n=1 Tax=Spironucleus salmonicida TaxID=348837 RepID=V6LPS8_9EUKA|eukprot:EST46667.1 Hypothetical protein SS50377_13472 [Spironucleus salmonicida]
MISSNDLYLSHPNIFRKGKIYTHMLKQYRSYYEQFVLPDCWVSIFDKNCFYQDPQNIRFLLKQHSLQYRKGQVTSHMLYHQTIAMDNFTIPELFNQYLQNDTTAKIHKSIKQTVQQFTKFESKSKNIKKHDENLTPKSEHLDTQEKNHKKHMIKDFYQTHIKS